MKIPEGYALVKIADLPAQIAQAIETVMNQKQATFRRANVEESAQDLPSGRLYFSQRLELRLEIGKHVAEAIASAPFFDPAEPMPSPPTRDDLLAALARGRSPIYVLSPSVCTTPSRRASVRCLRHDFAPAGCCPRCGARGEVGSEVDVELCPSCIEEIKANG